MTTRRIGDYEVIRKLGRGSMGEVFLVKKEGESGFVSYLALKRIHASMTDDKEIVRGLIREARIGGLLRHQSLVHIHELMRVRDHYIVTMEYVDGADLAGIILAQKLAGQPMDPRAALKIISQVGDGLHFAHNLRDPEGNHLGLIHRDLKPANVRISRDGAVKVMDFGIARSLQGTQSTRAGTLKGTVRYMAPEQARGLLDLDHRVDVYAMGAVLFEALTGVPLYPQTSMFECLGAVQLGEVEERLAFVQEELRPLLATALAHKPADRFESARACSDAARELAAELPRTLPFPRQLEQMVQIADGVAAQESATDKVPEADEADDEGGAAVESAAFWDDGEGQAGVVNTSSIQQVVASGKVQNGAAEAVEGEEGPIPSTDAGGTRSWSRGAAIVAVLALGLMVVMGMRWAPWRQVTADEQENKGGDFAEPVTTGPVTTEPITTAGEEREGGEGDEEEGDHTALTLLSDHVDGVLEPITEASGDERETATQAPETPAAVEPSTPPDRRKETTEVVAHKASTPPPVTIQHAPPASRLRVGEALRFDCATPGRSDCVVRAHYKAGSSTWTSIKLATSGEQHTGSLQLTADHRSGLEYYLATSGCDAVIWPPDRRPTRVRMY